MPDGPLPREASGPERGLSARRDELSCREGRWESPPLAIARGCEGGGGAGLLFWGVASERGGCMIIVEVSDASRLAEGGGRKTDPIVITTRLAVSSTIVTSLSLLAMPPLVTCLTISLFLAAVSSAVIAMAAAVFVARRATDTLGGPISGLRTGEQTNC